MIKVELNWTKDPDYNYGGRKHREMKNWCRATWGQNKRGQPQIWKSFYESKQSFVIDTSPTRLTYEFRLTFFFATQQQADWFSLRWLR